MLVLQQNTTLSSGMVYVPFLALPKYFSVALSLLQKIKPYELQAKCGNSVISEVV